MEEMLRDWLLKSKRERLKKDIEAYYLSLSEKEKKEDREWTNIAAESAKGHGMSEYPKERDIFS